MRLEVICDNCSKATMRWPSDARAKTLFCSTRCSALFHGEKRNITEEQFWARVVVGPAGDCWEWTGYRTQQGYGQLSWKGKLRAAHRIALSLTDGDWDNRLNVCHSCDNPPCCNPAHLWRGTTSQNHNDMIAKGRNRFITIIGEARVQATLTDAAVREIRSSTARGVDLARKYSVNKKTISRVRKHQAWRHLP